jgi:hypothetical protein
VSAQDTLQDRLADTRNHLKNRDEPSFRYSLIESYAIEGDLITAQNEIVAFETEIDLGESELLMSEWSAMKTYFSILLQAIGSDELRELHESQISVLHSLASDPWSFRAGNKAEALLRMNDTTSGYIEPLEHATLNSSKSDFEMRNDRDRPASYFPKVEVSPIPADHHINVSWWGMEQWSGQDGSLNILLMDNMGRLVLSATTDYTQYAHTMDISHLAPGLYHLLLNQNEQVVHNQKLLIE